MSFLRVLFRSHKPQVKSLFFSEQSAASKEPISRLKMIANDAVLLSKKYKQNILICCLASMLLSLGLRLGSEKSKRLEMMEEKDKQIAELLLVPKGTSINVELFADKLLRKIDLYAVSKPKVCKLVTIFVSCDRIIWINLFLRILKIL